MAVAGGLTMVDALSAWTFVTEDGAMLAVDAVRDLVAGGEVAVQDAVTLCWESGAWGPRVSQLPDLTQSGAPGAEFWGLLFGLTFAVPLIEAAVGRIGDEPASALVGIGVDQTFTHKLRDRLVPGSSALLVLSDEATLERLRIHLDDVERPEMTWVPVVLGDPPQVVVTPPDIVPPSPTIVTG